MLMPTETACHCLREDQSPSSRGQVFSRSVFTSGTNISYIVSKNGQMTINIRHGIPFSENWQINIDLCCPVREKRQMHLCHSYPPELLEKLIGKALNKKGS